MSRIAICADKAEALRMLDAGLLMLRIYVDEFEPASGYGIRRDWVVSCYGMSDFWPPEDFGYLVDDDDG